MSGLLENTIAYQVTIRRWGIKRQVPKALLRELVPLNEQKLVENRLLSASKKILESPEYDAIISRDGYAMRWLQEHSVPSILKRGIYCLPAIIVPQVDTYMEDYKFERDCILVPAFVEVYEERAQAAREILGDILYSSLEYPTVDQMSSLFRVETSYVSFDVPSQLKYISEEFFRREEERVKKQWALADQAVNQLLIKECTELVGGLQSAIKGLNDGSLKRFREANITNLDEWAELFLRARNVTDNQELADVVRQIRNTIHGVSQLDLKTNSGNVREYVGQAMAEIQQELKGMMEVIPTRIIQFDEEE